MSGSVGAYVREWGARHRECGGKSGDQLIDAVPSACIRVA